MSTPDIRVSPDALLYPFGYDPFFDNSIPPIPDICASIRLFSQKLEDEVAQIDFHLQHTESSDIRTSLEWIRVHICRSLDYHRAIIAPIRRLPTEMLSRIFSRCVDSEMSADKPGSREHYTSVPFPNRGIPWDITYVCRRWNLVAISIPSIWPRSFVVSSAFRREDRDDDGRPLTQGAIFLLGLCLERSQPLPLQIKFQYHFSPETRNYQSLFTDAATELFRHANRFRNLDLNIHPSNAIPNPFRQASLESVPFPRLESLICSGLNGVPPWLNPALEAAPKLHRLALENAQVFEGLSAPFSQTTHLTIGSPYGSANVDLALRALSSMPNLEDCSLYVSSSDAEHSTQTVTMPLLRNLSIESDGVVEEELTELLMLPSLQQITLFSPNEPATCVQRLIEKCHCTITHVGIMIEDSNITGLTALLPNLMPLRVFRVLVGASITALNVLLDILIMREDSYSVPGLEELHFEGLPLDMGDNSESVGDNEISRITEVIRSRLRPPPGSVMLESALRIVSLTFSLIPNVDQTQMFPVKEYLRSLRTPSREVMSNLGAACRMSPIEGSHCDISVHIDTIEGFSFGAVKYSFERKEWIFGTPLQSTQLTATCQ